MKGKILPDGALQYNGESFRRLEGWGVCTKDFALHYTEDSDVKMEG